MSKPISASVKNSLVTQLQNIAKKQLDLRQAIQQHASQFGHLNVKVDDVLDIIGCQQDIIVLISHILDGISE